MLTLTGVSYKDKETIPLRYTHHTVQGGENISPGFSWNDPPPGTKSYVFSLIDPHPVAKNWVHWCIINMPQQTREIVEGASRTNKLPPGAKELMSTYNQLGYGGPSPPPGSGVHPYVATLYSLNVEKLDLPDRINITQLQSALKGKVIAEAVMTGYYEIR
jgi:Raf kinase inhibitor-like YbhB/YbcL family protein